MVFCRGCGKEIHDSAPTCPHCGATQGKQTKDEKPSSWMAILALILGILIFISAIGVAAESSSADSDTLIGGFILAIPSIILAAVHLTQRRPGQAMPISAIALSSIGLLVLIGSAA